jgi:Kef-type K+ transport system membrane component KefB
LAQAIRPVRKKRLALAYAVVVGFPAGALVIVLRLGGRLAGARPLVEAAAAPAQHISALHLPDLALLVAQLGVIIAVSRAAGSVAQKIGQTRVIGEILAGILLGPSFLGWLAPEFSAALFPPHSFAVLNALSQLGLVLFMFLVGLELNWKELRHQGPVAILVSHASIAAPMAMGAALAVYCYSRLAGPTVGFVGFALFMGIATSITAFPVLARILSERKLLGTHMGAMAIACAAIDDVTGWCVLAYVVAHVRAADHAASLWMTIGGLVLFVTLMIAVVRKLLGSLERAFVEQGTLSDNRKAFLLLFLLLSALTTEMLGLHLLFGAFLAGVVMPRNRALVSYVTGKFESLTVLLLLPLFFAYTGLRMNIGRVNGIGMWGVCVAITAVAIAGKIGGTSVAARLGGIGWKESLGLGALMNTRGLMELVVLNIGLDIQVISPPLFSMMIVMALVTTAMTSPLLNWFEPDASEATERESRAAT